MVNAFLLGLEGGDCWGLGRPEKVPWIKGNLREVGLDASSELKGLIGY